MSTAILLDTKFYVPRSPRGLVERPRLSEHLARGAASKLMLVSAPAGFGKTTLLADWLAAGPAAPTDERAGAWLSLDREDDNPASFWAYVIASLRTAAPGVGAGALALLQSSRPLPMQTVLTTLLNELGTLASEVVLVLDDYHVIDSREVHDGMTFLLDHLPARLHLVIATRADPALPLARLRGRGELVELRATELRFTPDEAAAYLNGVMGLTLTAQDMAALEGRTEGWIAALQLAALSMQGRDDFAGFIADFAGEDRYIVDYLVEEVLQRQPEDIQTFLLQTSILGRLSGPLCDAVTGHTGGKTMLEALDRGNLFLVPLDDRRRWYRYHHLFADVLRARLLDEHHNLVQGLHRRASDWYEQNGERAAAVDHALTGEDFARAADLVELAVPAMAKDRREATLRGWFERLPETLFHVRPVLSIGYVGALMSTGEVEGVEPRLRDAERWLAPGGDGHPQALLTEMVVLDWDEFRRLPSWVAIYRAAQALLAGDTAATVTYARRGLDLLAEEDHLGRGAAAALVGLASWRTGDLAAARAGYAESMASLQRAGHIADVLGCAIALADIQIVQGHLGEAMRTYEGALQLAAEHAGPALRGTADMYVGMAALHHERGDLPAATELLLRSQELGEHNGLPQNPHRWRVAMARVRESEGNLHGALDLLHEAERVYAGDFSPNVRPIPALRARVWIAQGRLRDAFGWVREQGLDVADDISYLREFEHITLARALLARHKSERAGPSLTEATGLLGRLLRAADGGDRVGSVIEILELQALAHHLRGDIPAALAPLTRALKLAESEGYVRVFVDEGPPMEVLLTAAAEHRIAQGYARGLLTAFGAEQGRTPSRHNQIERLSERELHVLRLLGTDLVGPDIARELVVSLNTVRTHTKNIYTKLGVNNRRAAVRRAEELDLLRPRRSAKPSPS